MQHCKVCNANTKSDICDFCAINRTKTCDIKTLMFPEKPIATSHTGAYWVESPDTLTGTYEEIVDYRPGKKAM
jgi:recombinational DNA repair protein RecR